MADNPRIEELRGRVQRDPSSIAFAQLGEEYRRAGHFEEAIKTCRTGLSRHPGYLFARVTLGRALIETQEFDAAEAELSVVLKVAPENLAAIRGLADVHHQRGDLGKALIFYRRAPAPREQPALTAPVLEASPLVSPDLESILDLEAVMSGAPSSPAERPVGLSVEQAPDDFMSLEPPLAAPTHHEPAATEQTIAINPPVPDNPDLESLPDLEAFLNAITVYRQGSASSSLTTAT